jgi:hypothetical protein
LTAARREVARTGESVPPGAVTLGDGDGGDDAVAEADAGDFLVTTAPTTPPTTAPTTILIPIAIRIKKVLLERTHVLDGGAAAAFGIASDDGSGPET